MKLYKTDQRQLSPHIFCIGKYLNIKIKVHCIVTCSLSKITGSDAMKALKVKKRTQCIIITGISGSGKTFTTNCLTQFLSSEEMANRTKNVCRILDTFGNCETTQNHNSSRFVKILQVTL